MPPDPEMQIPQHMQSLNEELENYFANTIIPQLFVDSNFVLRKFTPPAMRQFTLSKDDIGRSIRDVVDNIRYPTLIQNIEEVITTGTPVEKEIQTFDRRWFQMNILPYIIRKENKTNGAIITFVDITSRIKTLTELEKLNADNNTFIYSVSHDIRQPISVLSLMSEALEYDFKTKNELSFKDNIERLNRSVSSIKRIMDDFSNLLKIKDVHSEAERVNIENICEDVILTLKDELHGKDIQISTEFSVTEFFFSRKNLRSIVYNLLSNSIKYRDPQRQLKILIKTDQTEGFLRLSIKDNGLGIAKKDQQWVFEKYTRLNTNVEGTGVGLYLIRNMIENHNGKIEVQSDLNEGAVFNVYFK
jgi:two-component system phosphate regulon sensor histidine kinase PhoR